MEVSLEIYSGTWLQPLKSLDEINQNTHSHESIFLIMILLHFFFIYYFAIEKLETMINVKSLLPFFSFHSFPSSAHTANLFLKIFICTFYLPPSITSVTIIIIITKMYASICLLSAFAYSHTVPC